MSVIIANATGEIDSAYHSLVKHIQSPLPIVMVSSSSSFIFNEELLSLKEKEFILVDFKELGWDYNWQQHSLENYHDRFRGEEWKKFHEWIYGKPLMGFIRELDIKTANAMPNVYPIDYPTTIEPIPIQSEEEFNNRPLSACYYFGRSHEERLRLHSRIWDGATRHGYSVCDNIFYYNGFMQNESGKKYFSANIPHYHRHPIEQILTINGQAKIGLVPHGAGIKTFRATEVSANAVPLLWEDNLAWSYEWIHGVNCLRCVPGKEIETIEEWTQKPELYDIYKNAVETCDKYRVNNYINNYILPNINKV